MENERLDAARGGDERAFRELIAPHQRELRAFCYRMSGSLADADDLLQESLLRAWRGLKTFEGRSSLRTWLYRVTWSACVHGLEARPRRELLVDRGGPADPRDPMPPPVDDWIGPCPPSLYDAAASDGSPAVRYSSRESVALAFLAALQLLPPRQRAILIARDVLGWSAEECASGFETTVASVTSALQRARETIDERAARWRPKLPDDETTRRLLARYIAAWEGADSSALAALLHEDAAFSMPPLPIWLLGPRAISESVELMVFASDGPDAFRFVPTEANGLPALAAYRRRPDGRFGAASIHAFAIRGDRIAEITVFLDPTLVTSFGLPPEHDGSPR
jgi:RNA polymerase sigma-70 factor, ECF subfamily